GVLQRVAELGSLVHLARRLRRVMAGYAARKRELLEEALHPRLVPGDVGIDLGVRALQVRVGDHPGAAVPGAGDVDHVEVARLDDPVEVRVDQVEARRGPEVAEQPRLDVPRGERLLEQRIVVEVDLADRQIVRRPPVRVDPAELLRRQSSRHRRSSAGSAYTAAWAPSGWRAHESRSAGIAFTPAGGDVVAPARSPRGRRRRRARREGRARRVPAAGARGERPISDNYY